jgi:hypothetical protein
LPENPAGMIELSDEYMGSVVGGVAAGRHSVWCCGIISSIWDNPVSELSEAGFVSGAGFVSEAGFDTFSEILEP